MKILIFFNQNQKKKKTTCSKIKNYKIINSNYKCYYIQNYQNIMFIKLF